MPDLEKIIAEFDPDYRIVHITAKEPLKFSKVEEALAFSKKVQSILNDFLSPGRGYMITDYSKIIIDPGLIDTYGQEMRIIMDTYLYPNGVARYGFEITRITAKMSHANFLGGTPNLFDTREEAFEFIRGLTKEEVGVGFKPESDPSA